MNATVRGVQLDLLDLVAAAARCRCGHERRLHLGRALVREDRRACRAFVCYCPAWKEDDL